MTAALLEGSTALTSWPMLVVGAAAGAALAVAGVERRRRAASRRIEDAEIRLDLALAASQACTFALDLHRDSVTLGPCAGVPERTLTRAAFVELIHPEEREQVVAALDACRSGGARDVRVVFRHRGSDDEGWAWWQLGARVPSSQSTGAPRHLTGLLVNITAARAAEERATLQGAALEATADAVVITDRSGRVQWCNPAFLSLTGYTEQEVVGRNPRELVKSGVQPTPFYEQLWSTVLSGKVWAGELVNRKRDGDRYLETQTITPIRDKAGEISHFVVVKRDITAQRQMEAQFHQAQKMESIGRLVTSVAHDFNNLLTVINANLDLTLQHIPEGAQIRGDIDEARRAGTRAVILTRQLLRFSRNKPVEMDYINLSRLVDDARPMLERLLGDRVELVVEPEPGLAPILADRGRLEQVLLNLVTNAFDAMPDGGTLAIGFTNHPGQGDDPVGWVEFWVRDTGIGMDEATQARIFEPFFSTKAADKGTGLGLSTVNGIITAFNGQITVESAPGQGSTFRIRFPAAQYRVRPDSAAIPTAPVAPAPHSARVLIVEDEAPIRRVARRALEQAGHVVLEAGSAEEALALLSATTEMPDLVLTDLMMPGITGGALLRRLRRERGLLRGIVMSGYSPDETRSRSDIDPDIEFLPKPFSVEELRAKVAEVLAN